MWLGVVLISDLRLPACVDVCDFLVFGLLLAVGVFLGFEFCAFGDMLLLGIWLLLLVFDWRCWLVLDGLGFRVDAGGLGGVLVVW